MNQFISALEKPELYKKSETEFWNDDYISKQMLDAHLNPDFEGASRKLSFIEQSAKWITEILPPTAYSNLLDLGCGPGLYAERFQRSGYQVTGVDFSNRSIQYAINSALNQNLPIQYYYQNYLNLDLKEQFDLITMIYCDYGALSLEDRCLLLKQAYHYLKPNGRLLLDIFSMKPFQNFVEEKTWNVYPNGGFWRKDYYLSFEAKYKYEDHISLRQTTIVQNNEITPYYLWDTYFTEASIREEVETNGFELCEIYGDVSGVPYCNKSETIAVILKKK